ncbi:hypothetical protein [Carboxylicivirga sp. RSCT41]|uniref:hypothetical protein n=1 Tax=Carboxylicivirga agarovorans TaxID=3417570 RepID=UPI003D32E195
MNSGEEINWPVEELIPQRDPFVFIDGVTRFSDIAVTTTFEIKASSPFVNGTRFEEAGLIENMAQSAAALEGCNARKNNSAVKIGFIGSVKQLEIISCPEIGDVLETQVTIVNNAMGVNIAEGVVRSGNRELAKCVLNIFLKED